MLKQDKINLLNLFFFGNNYQEDRKIKNKIFKIINKKEDKIDEP